MSGETSGRTSRISGDLCIGYVRYADSDDKPLWRLRSVKNMGAVVIEADATVGALTELHRFCESALEAVRSDGGRLDAPAPSEKG